MPNKSEETKKIDNFRKSNYLLSIVALSNLASTNAFRLNNNSCALFGIISTASIALNFWNVNNNQINLKKYSKDGFYKSLISPLSTNSKNHSLLNQNLINITNLGFTPSGDGINFFNEFSYSPLIYSIANSQPILTQRLLQLGADPFLKNQDNNSAFDFALTCNENSIFRNLLQFNDSLTDQKTHNFGFWNHYQEILQDRFILMLSYNSNSAPKKEVADIGCIYRRNLDNIAKITEFSSFPNKELVRKAISMIQKSLINPNDYKFSELAEKDFTIFEVPYYDKHLAFFTIKNDKATKNQILFYIDGNLPNSTKLGPGALAWQIDNAKLANSSKNIVDYLNGFEIARESLIPSAQSFKKILNEINKITINPKLNSNSLQHLRVPIINYDLDDCQMRSHNILTKLIIAETNSKLDDKIIRKIYDDYIKEALIADRLNNLEDNMSKLPINDDYWTKNIVQKISNLSEKIIKVANQKIADDKESSNDFDKKILKSALIIRDKTRFMVEQLATNKSIGASL